MVPTNNKCRALAAAAILFVLITLLYSSKDSSSVSRFHSGGTLKTRHARFAKASMLYGPTNEHYERALASHKRHNARYGYEMHILRRDITQGYWNKLAFLMNLVWEELQKPEEKRVDWIAWFNPDVVLLNPQIPLDIFLPPADPEFDHISYLGSRSDGQLNTGVFFLRVDAWSFKFLVKAMAMPMLDPDADLGLEMDRSAMALILNETEFRTAVHYEPHSWFNTSSLNPASEGQTGDLCVQIPASLGAEKWPVMNDMLNSLESFPQKWEKPVQETIYKELMEAFWGRVREATAVKNEAIELRDERGEDASIVLMETIDQLEELLAFQPDHSAALDMVMKQARKFVTIAPHE